MLNPFEQTMSNPYNYNKPVIEIDFFAGRTKLIEKAQRCFTMAYGTSPQYLNMAILGDRGVGKTSLLNILNHLAQFGHNLLTVKIPLNNDLVANELTFFNQILVSVRQAITAGLETIGVKSTKKSLFNFFQKHKMEIKEVELNIGVGKIKSELQDAPTLIQQDLKNSLASLHGEAVKYGYPAIVLSIDEAQLLGKNQTILQIIRNTFENLDGYCLMLSGSGDLLSELSNTFESIRRFFVPLKVSNFENWQETHECIVKPLGPEEKSLADEAFARDVFDITGGKPFIVKMLSFYAYDYAKRNQLDKMVLTPFVLESVIAESDSEDYEEVKEKLSLKKSEIHELDDGSQFAYGIDFYDDGSLDLDDSSRGVVVFVNKLIDAAAERNASDILIEPQPTNAIVKFKIDNQFHPVSIIPKSFINSVTSRIKIISNLDIAERRLPQESARFEYKTSTATVNCAAYTVPTKGGAEIIKLNFLYDFVRQLRELKALLLEEDSIGKLKAAFEAADGLVLMCGDIRQHATYLIHTMGSILKTKNSAVHIIEEADFIDTSDTIQIKLNPRIGLDRLKALQSVFKLDPQIVLLDDLLDKDVLSFAVKKAYKGSKCCIIGPLFLESFSRLLAYLSNQAGISTYDIAGALNKALNITFIRRNCESCKAQYALGDSDRLLLQKLGLSDIAPMQGTGCDTCWGTGYNGSHMLLELLDFNDDLSAAFIAGEVDAARISQAISPAFGTISEQAIRCLKSGTTSLEEFRATL